MELLGITPAAAQMVGYVVTTAFVAPLAGFALWIASAGSRLRW